MKKLIVTFLIAVAVQTASAQMPKFSKSTATYVRLSSGTKVVPDSVWDEPSDWLMQDQRIPLGFMFKMFGHAADTLLWEQGAITWVDENNDTTVAIGMGADLIDRGYGGTIPKSPISWERQGTAGNYIVKLQWSNFGFFDDYDQNGSSKDSGNLQLWIYQNPNKMELHFGPSHIAVFDNIFPDGLPVLAVHFDGSQTWMQGLGLDGSPSSPTAKTPNILTMPALTSYPANGTVYTFDFSNTNSTREFASKNDGIYLDGDVLHAKGNQSFKALHIYNTAGQLVKVVDLDENGVSVADLPTGIYIAKALNNSAPVAAKFYKP